ncbi:glycosyltransferase [Leptodesmis sp.]|uniref:glycosyltransferase n=1 Tax=Leptodesmis sp. TaxID=3100501 RepID=UPI0040535968
MDWPNSTLELPANPEEWVPFLETLLDDEAKLAEISHHNYRECRLRHDWRYRLRDLFTMMHLPIPQALEQELDEIRQRLGLNEKVQDGPHVLEEICYPVEVGEFQGMRSRY